MNYRYDNRSEEEFIKDIKDRTLQERSLFLLWLDLIEKETGTRPKYKDKGCGKTGELLSDQEVSTNPDFDVDGYGLVEIKFAKSLLKRDFHLKVNQVKQYVKQNASILMINGADEKNPVFTMLKSETLKTIMKECPVVNWVGFGYKPSYRIPIKKYLWRHLK